MGTSNRPGSQKWGSVARRGGRALSQPVEGRDSRGRERNDRDDVGRRRGQEPTSFLQSPRQSRRPDKAGPQRSPRVADRWIDEGPVVESRRATGSGTRRRPAERADKLPDPVALELARALPPSKTAKTAKRLVDASKAFQDDRHQDTLRILRPLLSESPDIPTVRELAGLALYRQGKWAKAAEQLEAFRALTRSEEQNPVLADCYRALGRHKKVDELWAELRAASPGIGLLTEGRIVAAGSLADRGEITAAIVLLSRGPLTPRRSAEDHHVRLWYALADLYERSGDAPRARELFRRVAGVEPDLADTAERLASLG